LLDGRAVSAPALRCLERELKAVATVAVPSDAEALGFSLAEICEKTRASIVAQHVHAPASLLLKGFNFVCGQYTVGKQHVFSLSFPLGGTPSLALSVIDDYSIKGEQVSEETASMERTPTISELSGSARAGKMGKGFRKSPSSFSYSSSQDSFLLP